MKFRQRCAIALVLVITMVFLSACQLLPVVTQLMATATPVATAIPTLAPTPEPTQEVVPEYTAGITEGYEYRSEYFRFGCRLDDSWTIATPEELAELRGLNVELMRYLNVPDYLIERTQEKNIYEFMAEANRGLQSIIISAEDASDQLTVGDDLDMDTVLTLTKRPLLNMLEQAGMEIISSDNVNVFIEGIRKTGTFIEMDDSGLSTYMLIVMMQRGTYLVTINITTVGSDITDDILENFYLIQ